MAILGKIQRSSGLLIGMIGVAMFAFIIMDLLQNSSSLFRPSMEYVGKVDGEKIPSLEFKERMQAMQKRYGPDYPASAVMKQVWDQMVNEKLLENELKKIGAMVPSDRIFDRIKSDPQIQQMFTNEQGVFDENKLADYLEEINESKDVNPQDYEIWKKYQEDLKRIEAQRIFSALVKSAMVPTIKEGEWAYHKDNDRVSFHYVMVPYSKIPDSTVSVSDLEIEKYMKEHRELYKTDENRSIEYVKFEFKPSRSDYQQAEEEVKKLIADQVVYDEKSDKNDTIPGFASTTEPENFLKKYSDELKPVRWYTSKTIPKVIDTLMHLEKGQVYGPVLNRDRYVVYKVVDKRKNVPEKAKAKHILISYSTAETALNARTEEEAQKLADSILNVVKKNPSKFDKLAAEFSDDRSNKDKGGDLGEFPFGRMVDPFNDFVFSARKGQIGKVKTRFGYHIIKVEDLSKDKTDAVKVVELERMVEPSEQTLDSIYAQAARFTVELKNSNIQEAAKKFGKSVMPVKKIKRYDTRLPGLGDQPAIASWLYNEKTKVGDYKRFETQDGYVIAQLVSITPEGLMPLEEASILIKPILIKKKKFEMLKEKIKGDNLDEIAKNANGIKGKAKDVTMEQPVIPSVGKEPVVVAVAFAVPLNKISRPVEGEMGAFVVQPFEKHIAKELSNYYTYIQEEKKKREANFFNKIFEALKKKADIKDNRVILGY